MELISFVYPLSMTAQIEIPVFLQIMKKQSGKYSKSISWAIIILFIALIPGNVIPKVPKFIELFSPDKIIHFILFGILIFLLLFEKRPKNQSKFLLSSKSTLFILFIGIVYGGTIELLQLTLPVGRSGNYVDFLADVIGCFAGFLIFWIFSRNKGIKKSLNRKKN